jgi:hypothetical protein
MTWSGSGPVATSRTWSAADSRSLASVGVDARVLGDLVDPWLERDGTFRLAHPAQRGDEHLLRDVLGSAVVLDHAADVGGDAAVVAGVELLEGAVVAAAHSAHQVVVGALRRASGCLDGRRVSRSHRSQSAFLPSA